MRLKYVGKDPMLFGKTALAQEQRGNCVHVQFDDKKLISLAFGWHWFPAKDFTQLCQFCGLQVDGTVTYRQRTEYTNESENWVTACPDCKRENDEYWDGMWAEYYANCM